MAKTKRNILVLGVFSLFFTGCWDRVEIEDRGFLIGVAMDLVEVDNPGEKYRYKGTYQFVVPAGLSRQGRGGGAGSQKTYENVSSISDSVFEQARDLAPRVSRTPFSEHLQLIIISEEVAKTPRAFANVLDLFIRDNEMRRGIILMISEGEASPILDVQPTPESLPVMLLDSIAGNVTKNAKMLPEIRLGTVHERLIDKTSFVIPKVKLDGQTVNMTGAAVFHGHNSRMIDFISGDMTEGLNLITGEYKGGLLKIDIENESFVYEIKNVRNTVNVDIQNDEHIDFDIKIDAEGIIAESYLPLNYMSEKTLSKAEKAIEKELVGKASETVRTFQEELETDALGLGGYVQREDYETWQRIKKNWDHGDNIFAKSTINIEADAVIRSSGAVIESQEQLREGVASMWEKMLGRLPYGLIMFAALLSVIVPLAIYILNQKLHKYGDPPWKKSTGDHKGNRSRTGRDNR